MGEGVLSKTRDQEVGEPELILVAVAVLGDPIVPPEAEDFPGIINANQEGATVSVQEACDRPRDRELKFGITITAVVTPAGRALEFDAIVLTLS